jgi:Transcriptional Coactivator p15 (PC4)
MSKVVKSNKRVVNKRMKKQQELEEAVRYIETYMAGVDQGGMGAGDNLGGLMSDGGADRGGLMSGGGDQDGVDVTGMYQEVLDAVQSIKQEPIEPAADVKPDVRIEKIHLGNNRFLSTSIFNGKMLIHIRQYEGTAPTKRGLAFPTRRFASFVNKMDIIDRQFHSMLAGIDVNFKLHLGGGVYATIVTGFKCVNLRKYFVPKGSSMELPSRTGIALRVTEWFELKNAVRKLFEQYPELVFETPCYNDANHMNLMEAVECKECNPFYNYGLF